MANENHKPVIAILGGTGAQGSALALLCALRISAVNLAHCTTPQSEPMLLTVELSLLSKKITFGRAID